MTVRTFRVCRQARRGWPRLSSGAAAAEERAPVLCEALTMARGG